MMGDESNQRPNWTWRGLARRELICDCRCVFVCFCVYVEFCIHDFKGVSFFMGLNKFNVVDRQRRLSGSETWCSIPFLDAAHILRRIVDIVYDVH